VCKVLFSRLYPLTHQYSKRWNESLLCLAKRKKIQWCTPQVTKNKLKKSKTSNNKKIEWNHEINFDVTLFKDENVDKFKTKFLSLFLCEGEEKKNVKKLNSQLLRKQF
jgi:hypothetical protein